ncbi:MAG: Aliphatic sulfonates import ATP-binding protein SsuB [Syntrophomonadaceae bacterium]|nr:Aliphatic sulfonates import ATP-binding protein SsuB [Bacillota bacterium]
MQENKPRVKIKVCAVGKKWPLAAGEQGLGENKSLAALEAVDLEIYEGEFLCLLGPSGCGKTTLLNILAGFERPSSGHVLIDGEAVQKPHPKRITIFQEYALLPWRSVLGNVEFGLEMARVPKKERQGKARELLELVELTGAEGMMPRELSGGMRQRVAVARSLAVDPDILFMDEPFGALDALTRIRMEEELVRIWLQKKKTIVFVTHDIDEAVYLADRIAVFSVLPGRIREIIPVAAGRPRDRTGYDFVRLREKVFASLSLGYKEPVEYYL